MLGAFLMIVFTAKKCFILLGKLKLLLYSSSGARTPSVLFSSYTKLR